MNRFLGSRLSALALIAASLALTACGGGGGTESNTGTGASATPPPTGSPVTPGTPPSSTAATTPGVWKGSIESTTTGQTSSVVALTGADGHSVWMTTDGRVWSGQVPMTGDHFDTTFSGHMYEGVHFPDGTNHGTTSMMIDQHSTTATSGRYTGSGDAGTFNLSLSPMWDRAASLGTVAGVYTRSTSNGYTMTMTISTNGQLTANDSRGCLFNGAVGVPDLTHNMYSLNATVTSCGSLDGTYSGMGALLDADAMQDWMTAMHPLEQGGHTHGGSMMGGSPMMGHNTVPTGQRNLFMFSLFNDRNGIMDALAR
jgi:hypothetical protein